LNVAALNAAALSANTFAGLDTCAAGSAERAG
jgi:hypothetical protein